MTEDEFRKLSDQKFKMIATDISGNGEIRFAIPIPGADHLSYVEDETSAYILDPIEDWMEAWDKYVESLQAGAESSTESSTPKKRNRTRKKAAEEGAITDMPDRLAVPTLRRYQNSMNLTNDSVAHLQTIEKALADRLQSNGVVRVEGGDAGTNSLEQRYDKTPEALSEVDVPLLLSLYTIIRDDFMKSCPTMDAALAAVEKTDYLNHGIRIYLPDFMRMLGKGGNASKDGQNDTVKNIMKLDSVAGIIIEEANGRVYQSVYPAMRFMGYDAKSNVLHFASPYCNILMATLLKKSIKRDRQGRPKLKSNGEPFTLPSHSYLIKSSIAKEPNKRAVEIVCAVVTLIEQCGDHTPHIKVQTLIDRCPLLKMSLERASSGNKSLVLKRAFTKAWEILPKQTLLKETYKEIKLPTTIPATNALEEVITFPHKGKIKRNND